MTIVYRRSGPEDLPQIRGFWREHWGDEFVVSHGVTHRPGDIEGFLALDGSEWVGLVTYQLVDACCEIVTLDSLRAGEGIGTRLVSLVRDEASRMQCRRLFLITTNDNLEALGFYQKRGFRLVRLNRGAVDEARKVKPRIPAMGMHGIPLRDELELEIELH